MGGGRGHVRLGVCVVGGCHVRLGVCVCIVCVGGGGGGDHVRLCVFVYVRVCVWGGGVMLDWECVWWGVSC